MRVGLFYQIQVPKPWTPSRESQRIYEAPAEIWNEYVRCFNEKTIRGSCGDYRAAPGIDCELDTADLGRKLNMPILVLWGQNSSVGKRFADPIGICRQRAEDVRGEALPSGHYVNEEAPEQVLDWFLRFFG